jgi:chemotaxis protein MotB
VSDRDVEVMLHGGQEDELWLISYADLLTLLIGFFVLLIAVSPIKTAQFERLAASISGGAPPPLEELKEKVDEYVAREGLQQQVLTREDREGLAIELKDVLLFDSGSADIRPEGHAAIAHIARLLQTLPRRPVVIEGHTDDLPIRTPRFASNWELSTQRAINVRAAIEQGGVARELMSVRGFADTRGVDSKGTAEEQRTANRRVVIRVE